MILMASDASSLARSLSRWEVAEYFSCALVALGCAGEYVSEFTNWLTAGDEERQKRLAKRSTLLLIASLALELVCLVRTNSLSGQLIGSLSDKASSADAKAQSALEKSEAAKTKADAADMAADGALRKAREAEEYAAWRTISDHQAKLIRAYVGSSLDGHTLTIQADPNETETWAFANRIALSFGMMRATATIWPQGWIVPAGLKFSIGKNRKKDFDLMVKALGAAGVDKAARLRKQSDHKGASDDDLILTVGPRH